MGKVNSIAANKNYKRLFSGPLDTTEIQDKFEDVQNYANSSTAYVGQIIYCKENNKLYKINANKSISEVEKEGPKGKPGKDGTSVTHRWEGTTLYLTSASGTTSVDLQGPKGDNGISLGNVQLSQDFEEKEDSVNTVVSQKALIDKFKNNQIAFDNQSQKIDEFQNSLQNKVEKDGNKVLSTNDFEDKYKNQLDAISDIDLNNISTTIDSLKNKHKVMSESAFNDLGEDKDPDVIYLIYEE